MRLKYRIGDTVKTLEDDGGKLFPIGTIGVIGEIDPTASDESCYKVVANGDYWWYSETMLESCEPKTYERGLSDAWELAKRVATLNSSDRREVFGTVYTNDVFVRFSYKEAFEIISEYDKKEKISVGDVVRINESGYNSVVMKIKDDKASLRYDDGSEVEWSVNALIKTGKHIDIEGLLRKIGE